MHELTSQNLKLRFAPSTGLLVCYSLYNVWQMGVMFFSGTALSIDGKTPLPVDAGNLTLVIALGYIASITILLFWQKRTVAAARASAVASMASALLLFAPFPPAVLAALFTFQAFCCVLMIGIHISISVNMFTGAAELKQVLFTALICCPIIALLQNDAFQIPYFVFHIITIIVLALLIYFYFKTPRRPWQQYLSKADGMLCPKRFTVGIFALICLSCTITLFGSAVAESVNGGISVFYLSQCVCGVIVFLLWKLKKISPLQSGAVFTGISAFGFVMAVASLYFHQLALPACALLGGGMLVCNLGSFYCIVLSKRYPSRFIMPVMMTVALATVLLQSALLTAFRENTAALYIIYAAITVCAAVIYLMLEPSFIWSLKKHGSESEHSAKAGAVTAENLRANAFDALSGQEMRMAELIMNGYTTSEIAQTLNITENTAKSYRKTLYSKLQIHSKRELFALANAPAPQSEKDL